MSGNAARRHRRRAERLELTPDPWGTFRGRPVYDGTTAEPIMERNAFGHLDGRVMVGIGPSGGLPVAYVCLCPCDGVDGFIEDLRDAAAIAAEHHPPHDFPMTRESET